MNKHIKDDEYFKSLGVDIKAARFKRYKKAGLLDEVDETFVEEAKQYWMQRYNNKLDPVLHIAFMNLTGKKDPRVAFYTTVRSEIIPFFNDQRMRDAYRDKNIYDLLIPTERSVVTVLKRVHGLYFDTDNNCLDKADVEETLLSYKEDFIVKPSTTNNGARVNKLQYKEDTLLLSGEKLKIKTLEEIYGGDFAVQKVIKQHPTMASPHPSSVNTLRMVTFRWKNEIRYLLTFARFGSNNGVQDNAGTGGLCLGVTDEGKFMDKAIDEDCNVYSEHPTTGFPFKDLDSVPNFEDFKQFVIDQHKNILHHDLVSWDIVVGVDGLPIFLEANFSGATWLYQLASQKPLFGDLTEEVLEHVYQERNDKNSPRRKSLSTNISKKGSSKKSKRKTSQRHSKNELSEPSKGFSDKGSSYKNELKQLQGENDRLMKERDRYKKEYSNIMKSSSWRMTMPLRKISSLLRKK
ncbi:sugar-transfer associated ATP-grasp domain-containing protein [Lacicoccus alkaliphilus]|uniref:Sugar-transfer associated ATP-grasp n=1 Tax=Lacicoccus alkaliphilus DSM 16010 TaxID=1123231 RepID=A0A1M7H6Z6_9BACL|nr:sugar-transfer associated ATP-grasp domain-containing protein [Salinicoccus alkaliphilus]SHM24158.1 Sugar-transfer associated ATP-grasp [Salinicoccus alkaliphilus DSM 16010]